MSVFNVGIFYTKYDDPFNLIPFCTGENLESVEFSETLGCQSFYEPCCIVNPTVHFVGFPNWLKNPKKTDATVNGIMNALQIGDDYYRLFLYDYNTESLIIMLNIAKDISRRYDGAYDVSAYCGYACLAPNYKKKVRVQLTGNEPAEEEVPEEEVPTDGSSSEYTPRDTTYTTPRDICDAINDLFTIDYSVINEETALPATPPVNVIITMKDGADKKYYSLRDALSIVCGFTYTFSSWRLKEYSSGYETQPVLTYPKKSNYILSDAYDTVTTLSDGRIAYPLYDGGTSINYIKNIDPVVQKQLFRYDSTSKEWKEGTVFAGNSVINYSNLPYYQSNIEINGSEYFFLDFAYASTDIKNFVYNAAELKYGELSIGNTNSGKNISSQLYSGNPWAEFIHGYSGQSVAPNQVYYGGSFRTIPTFVFKAGDIITASIHGTEYYIIANTVSVNAKGTTIESVGEQSGNDATNSVQDLVSGT